MGDKTVKTTTTVLSRSLADRFLFPPFTCFSSNKEWDSSSDEESEGGEVVAVADEDKKAATTARSKKSSSSSRKSKAGEETKESSVIYIGHLPPLFGERELTRFLEQFGGLTHVRVSRSMKTGNSKGYCFCRFVESSTAHIVADTLSGYLLLDSKTHISKRLVCHVVPPDKVHPRLFANAPDIGRAMRIRKARVHPKPSLDAMDKVTDRLVRQEEKKRKALAEAGIEYDFPGYAAALGRQSSKDDEPAKNQISMETKTEEKKSKKKRKDSVESVEEEATSEMKKPEDSVDAERKNKSNSKDKKEKKRSKSLDSSLAGKKKPSLSGTTTSDVEITEVKAKKKDRKISLNSSLNDSSSSKSKQKESVSLMDEVIKEVKKGAKEGKKHRKDSVSSVDASSPAHAKQSEGKNKQKDSVESTSSKNKKKRANSIDELFAKDDEPENEVLKVQSEKKSKKKKKKKARKSV
jgi:nucleolar protein 15